MKKKCRRCGELYEGKNSYHCPKCRESICFANLSTTETILEDPTINLEDFEAERLLINNLYKNETKLFKSRTQRY